MKKTALSLLTAALACVALAGCGAEPAPPPGGEAAPAASGEQTPVYGDQIRDGTYAIGVSSSSSMFRIVDAELTVKDGGMSAVLTLSGDGYEKLYMGTGEEALSGTDDRCIYFVENAEGKYTYEVPVAALDRDTPVAAWSIRKKTWYDRVLVFQASRIPEDAITAAQAEKLPADGRYTIEVALSGGSGRARVESPAELTVNDGAATAVVVWSSPYYEHMRTGGNTYYPVNTGGNSAFEIPVALDRDMAVSAQTVAMSEPHEIDYTLRFDSATLRPLQNGKAAPSPLRTAAIAAALIVPAAGVLLIAARRAKGRKAAEEK